MLATGGERGKEPYKADPFTDTRRLAYRTARGSGRCGASVRHRAEAVRDERRHLSFERLACRQRSGGCEGGCGRRSIVRPARLLDDQSVLVPLSELGQTHKVAGKHVWRAHFPHPGAVPLLFAAWVPVYENCCTRRIASSFKHYSPAAPVHARSVSAPYL